jgi:septal ring factor EnvC (AmiA/AmiB activator)
VSAAAAATKDQDLVDTMRLSLEDERTTRAQLAQQLASTETTLAQREQNLAALTDDKTGSPPRSRPRSSRLPSSIVGWPAPPRTPP